MFAEARLSDLWFHLAAALAAVGLGLWFVVDPQSLALCAAVVAAVATVAFAPLPWLTTGVVFGLLLGPTYKVGGPLASDLAVGVAALLAATRGRRVLLRPAERWLAFLAWALLVTRLGPGTWPLLHTFAPVAGGYLVASLVGPAVLWRAVRWWALISIATAPLLMEGSRWSGLPGGPNELGLLCAALVVLAFAQPSRWRYAQVAIGFVGLAGAASVSSGIAVAVGLLVLRPGRAPSMLKFVLVGGAALIVASRPDLLLTIAVHGDQAKVAWGVLNETNWLTGGGWLHGSQFIASGPLDTRYGTVLYDTVHNTYLQLLTDTGMIGLGLFLAALYGIWRRSDHVGRAVLAVVAVWLNTTAAFPGPVWGLLGVVLATTANQSRNHVEVPSE